MDFPFLNKMPGIILKSIGRTKITQYVKGGLQRNS